MSVGQDSAGPPATAGAQSSAGVTYTQVDASYFEARRLKRHARVWSLWALGVGAVISGHYSGWNLGLSSGFGAMFFATIIIAIMYLGLTFSIAEMSPALPHTGGALLQPCSFRVCSVHGFSIHVFGAPVVAAAGSRRVNDRPPSGDLPAATVPPWAVTMLWQMARPRPEPPVARLREPSRR